jgi:hypothetical protein
MSMAPDEVMSYAAVKIKRMVPEMIETVIGNMVPHLIEAAVLKGQIELLDMLSNVAINRSQNQDDPINPVIDVINTSRRALCRQLDHIATKEKDRGQEAEN